MKRLLSPFLRKLHFKFLARSILVLTIGVLGFETVTFYEMSQMVRGLTLENMRGSVQSASTKIDDSLARLRTDLDIISSLPALESFYLNIEYGLNSEALQYQKSLGAFFDTQSSRNKTYLAFKICDQNMSPMAVFSRDPELTGLIENTPCINDQTVASSQYLASTTKNGKQRLVVGHNVQRNERQLGKIEIYFDLTEYFQMVDNEPIYQSGFLAVVDNNGLALSTKDPERLILQKNALQKYAIDQTSDQFTTVTDDNNASVIIYQTGLQEINWSITAFAFEDEIFAPLYYQIKITAWLMLAMIISELLFLSYFTKRLITQRITSLVEATQRILSGNYKQRVPVKGFDEISQLSQSFNEMTQSLQNQLHNLEVERGNLQQNQQLLQNIIDHSSALVAIKEIDGRYNLVNHAFTNFFNLQNEQVIGKTDLDLFPAAFAEQYRKNDTTILSTGIAKDFEEISIDRHGDEKTLLSAKFPLKNNEGKIYATCGISSDISQRIDEEKALQKLNAKLTLSNTVLKNIIEAVIVTDAEFNIIDVNPATEKQFGFTRKELIGRKPSILRSEKHDEPFFESLYSRLASAGQWHGEIWEKTKDGNIIPLLLTVVCMRNEKGEITNYAGIYADISDIKKNEAKLQKLAHYDSLTGLANRLLVEERTSQAILQANREGHKVTMLFIDLDNFKYINDTLGHDVGDQLLVQAASRFKALLRHSDTLARQGGDEFVVLLAKTLHANDASIIANKIKSIGSLPFYIGEHELHISTSIGIAVYPDDADSTSGLFKCADMAMYSAKESGKNNFRFFSADLNHAAVNRLQTEKALRLAMEQNQLELYYQPQISVHNDKITKAEALLRWKTPSGEFIPPDLFIPIAEESGLIVLLGEWVVARAVNDLKKLNNNREQPIKISINLSARQFRHHDLARKLHQIIDDAGISPSSIEFEVTEGLLIDDFALAQKILSEIQDYGFSIALDDFGKGYSSLSYLKHFPIDTLKMDRTFMRDLISDPRTQAIVQASVTMAHALGMQVVFEGAETQEQYQYIRNIGNVSIQGYYCSKPLSVKDFLEFLPCQIIS